MAEARLESPATLPLYAISSVSISDARHREHRQKSRFRGESGKGRRKLSEVCLKFNRHGGQRFRQRAATLGLFGLRLEHISLEFIYFSVYRELDMCDRTRGARRHVDCCFYINGANIVVLLSEQR